MAAQISASQFKEQCLSLLDHLDADGLVITKHGKPVAKLPTDDARSVKAKYAAARSAQPRWAGVPLKRRLAPLARFREAVAS